jgi:hypothetical protein
MDEEMYEQRWSRALFADWKPGTIMHFIPATCAAAKPYQSRNWWHGPRGTCARGIDERCEFFSWLDRFSYKTQQYKNCFFLSFIVSFEALFQESRPIDMNLGVGGSILTASAIWCQGKVLNFTYDEDTMRKPSCFRQKGRRCHDDLILKLFILKK